MHDPRRVFPAGSSSESPSCSGFASLVPASPPPSCPAAVMKCPVVVFGRPGCGRLPAANFLLAVGSSATCSYQCEFRRVLETASSALSAAPLGWVVASLASTVSRPTRFVGERHPLCGVVFYFGVLFCAFPTAPSSASTLDTGPLSRCGTMVPATIFIDSAFARELRLLPFEGA